MEVPFSYTDQIFLNGNYLFNLITHIVGAIQTSYFSGCIFIEEG